MPRNQHWNMVIVEVLELKNTSPDKDSEDSEMPKVCCLIRIWIDKLGDLFVSHVISDEFHITQKISHLD